MIEASYVLLLVPDEELTEPIHFMIGPRQMLCGEETGLGVWQSERVTCMACRDALVRPIPEAG